MSSRSSARWTSSWASVIVDPRKNGHAIFHARRRRAHGLPWSSPGCKRKLTGRQDLACVKMDMNPKEVESISGSPTKCGDQGNGASDRCEDAPGGSLCVCAGWQRRWCCTSWMESSSGRKGRLINEQERWFSPMTLPPALTAEIEEVITHYPVSRRSAALPLLHLIQRARRVCLR